MSKKRRASGPPALQLDALEMKIEPFGSAMRWPGHDLPDWIVVHHPRYSGPVYMAADPPDKDGWRHYESGGMVSRLLQDRKEP
jgi:hypothetical protein